MWEGLTDAPSACKGVDKLIYNKYDEYPCKPTGNIGCGTESPICTGTRNSGRFRARIFGNSARRMRSFRDKTAKTHSNNIHTALKSKKVCSGICANTMNGRRRKAMRDERDGFRRSCSWRPSVLNFGCGAGIEKRPPGITVGDRPAVVAWDQTRGW